MQSRARALMINEPIPAAFEYFTMATPAEILPLLREWMDGHPDGLVMLDTLGKVMPPSIPGESRLSARLSRRWSPEGALRWTIRGRRCWWCITPAS